MADPIIFVDTSEIHEGKLDELKHAVAELAEFVESNEIEPIAYRIHFSEDGRRMTVLQIHPDSASMERHMELAGPVFARFADLVELRTVDIYGSPSEKVIEHLRRKADLLGSASVAVHERHAGFDRFDPRLVR
jgi:hypothetical protein